MWTCSTYCYSMVMNFLGFGLVILGWVQCWGISARRVRIASPVKEPMEEKMVRQRRALLALPIWSIEALAFK